MSEPYVTVLREIKESPDSFSPYVVASWCGKAADEIERLEARCLKLYNANAKQYERVDKLEAAVRKTLKELHELDGHHSAACMNCSFLEHSHHQCGLCDLRAALGESNGSI